MFFIIPKRRAVTIEKENEENRGGEALKNSYRKFLNKLSDSEKL